MLVCILRKASFKSFGLKKENAGRAVLGTILCFLPYIAYIVLSGQFEGYEPLSIMMTPDLQRAGITTAIAGTLNDEAKKQDRIIKDIQNRNPELGTG